MVHKRDLYLILNQTDILDCCIKLTVFQSFFFFFCLSGGVGENSISPFVPEISTLRSARVILKWQSNSHASRVALMDKLNQQLNEIKYKVIKSWEIFCWPWVDLSQELPERTFTDKRFSSASDLLVLGTPLL